jgi:PilZ domain
MNTQGSESRHNERRKAPRYNYQASLEIEWGSARLKGKTRDISAGGMFIEADDVLWVGAGFRAKVVVEKPVWVECSVKRVEPGLGMGVTIHAEEQDQRHFEDFLAKLATAS